ncbi:MAG: type II CRISPR RNA-guided endonuclease Cas9 [Firmicutes bacterium]|nr:type II CRISPR RNA-guided endonuclease Cas9 [Bacillota bacterium]
MNTIIKNAKEVFIGLDIGTESVGFSLTDENYQVPQIGGKPLMGVRLFDEAKTAAERRVFRASKVRQERTKFRTTLLQELFNENINKIDELFFLRLEASGFWAEDKLKTNAGLDSLDSLFADNLYSDITYFSEFPTIYHLRKFLCEGSNWQNNIPDIRLVYLACHHILKARGHFLYDGDVSGSGCGSNFSYTDEGKRKIKSLKELLLNEDDEEITPLDLSIDNFDKIESIAKDDKIGMGKNKMKEAFFNVVFENISKENKTRAGKITSAIIGAKFKLSDIINNLDEESLDDEISKSISFSNNWENLEPKIASELGDKYILIESLKNVYDWLILMKLLKGKKSVSIAMVDKFDEHNKQLQQLKALVKEKAKNKYQKIFRSIKETHNYAAYIGSNLSNGKTIVKKCTRDKFYDFLKKELTGILTEELIASIESGQFLPKLRTKDNATIPHQLHKAELVNILDNAVKYGLINEDISSKVISIMTYRVPYYVGRTNSFFKENAARHVWIEKKKNEKIRPWNYKDVIDLDKSGENFITRMLSQCTYLKNEKVLPKSSLLYSEFMVLNEINNLRINEQRIDSNLKLRIFNELFKKIKKVSVKALLEYLNSVLGLKNAFGESLERVDISGIDVQKDWLTQSLSSYHEAKKIFGDDIEKIEVRKIIEDVLKWHALHTDKNIVSNSIKKNYPELSEEIVKNLKGLNLSSKFGSLSQKFLYGLNVICYDTGLVTSIIDLLREGSQNLMEILHDPKYNIQEVLQKENYGDDVQICYEQIRSSYASPSVKRAVWQAMLVVDELTELIERKPNKIFIEVIRSGKAEKKRTKSRKDALKEIIKDKEILKELENASDDNLRGEKLYLYFLQNGKCAYSGESINISDMKDYDVDHIIPQALKKDDSISNKVLAKKVLNGLKDKNYPLNKTSAIWNNSSKLIKMWDSWEKCGLISNEKLQKLKRTAPLGGKELEGFIARQLVATSQSATVAADLFKHKYLDTEIVYSKAENVSDFRKKFDLLKCREINDLHHAHDAYLNIVVGNTFKTKFAFWKEKHEKTGEQKNWSQSRIFEHDVEGAWKKPTKVKNENFEDVFKRDGTLATVDKILKLMYLSISKKTLENKGSFYKQTVFSARAKQKEIKDGRKNKDSLNEESKLIPRKGDHHILNDTSKYGGYSGLRPAYFLIVEYKDKKGETQREFISVSLLDKKRWEKLNEQEKLTELADKFKITDKKGNVFIPDVKIVVPKILIRTLFEIGTMHCRLAGWNGSVVKFHNAKQLFIDKESLKYVRLISKYNQMIKDKKIKADDYAGKTEIEIAGKKKEHTEIQKLTKNDNEKLWDALLSKINDLYGNSMSILIGKNLGLPDVYKKIFQCSEKFSKLSIEKQITVLTSLIIGLSCNANSFAMKELGLGDTGIIQPSVKIKYPLILINQSVTGIKENRVVISKLDEDGNIAYPPVVQKKKED